MSETVHVDDPRDATVAALQAELQRVQKLADDNYLAFERAVEAKEAQAQRIAALEAENAVLTGGLFKIRDKAASWEGRKEAPQDESQPQTRSGKEA